MKLKRWLRNNCGLGPSQETSKVAWRLVKVDDDYCLSNFWIKFQDGYGASLGWDVFHTAFVVDQLQRTWLVFRYQYPNEWGIPKTLK